MMAQYLAASSASSRLGHHWKKKESEAPLRLRFMAKRHRCEARIRVSSRMMSLAWMVAFPLLYTAWNGWMGMSRMTNDVGPNRLLSTTYLIPRGIFELEGYDDTDAAFVVGKDIFALDSGGPRQMYGLKNTVYVRIIIISRCCSDWRMGVDEIQMERS